MRAALSFGALVLLLVLCAGPGATPVRAEAVVRVATGEWAPYVSRSLPEGGYTTEIISHAMLHEGVEVQFDYMPWPRAERMISSGQYALASPYVSTEQRREFGYFSQPFATSRTVFFAMRKNLQTLEWQSYDDLRPYRIAGVRGYFYVPWFAAAGIELDFASEARLNFKKLYMGRVDLVPDNELVGREIIARLYPNQQDDFVIVGKPLNVSPLCLMGSRFHPDGKRLIALFNKGFAAIKANGTLDAILAKYQLAQ